MKKPQMLDTKNYNLFKILEENRNVPEVRIERMISSIKGFDMTNCNPIIVNENMEIIDGQTRFMACKRMGFPIYYIKRDFKGKSKDGMIQLNAYQANWTLDDYVQLYAKEGKTPYMEALECKEKYGVSLSVAVSFVGNSTHSEPETVKIGRLKKGLVPYTVYGDILMDFKKIFKEYNHIFFIRALVYILNFKYYNHETEFKKFEKNRFDLIGCANTEQYLKMFEDILNHHRRGQKINILAEYPRTK